jgi:hypothetical protein
MSPRCSVVRVHPVAPRMNSRIGLSVACHIERVSHVSDMTNRNKALND